MSKVFIEEATLRGIANAIREKEGSTELIPPLEMPDRVREISGGGIAEEWVNSVALTSLNVLGKETAAITLPNATDLSNFAAPTIDSAEEAEGRVNITVKHLTINAPKPQRNAMSLIATSNYGVDQTLQRLTLNVDFSKASNLRYFLRNCQALKVIDGTPLNFSSATNLTGALDTLRSLVEVRFTGTIYVNLSLALSKNLSKESIASAMACLYKKAASKTLSLSQDAVDKAFETSPGATDGSSSAEWLLLADSASNWTISLL